MKHMIEYMSKPVDNPLDELVSDFARSLSNRDDLGTEERDREVQAFVGKLKVQYPDFTNESTEGFVELVLGFMERYKQGSAKGLRKYRFEDYLLDCQKAGEEYVRALQKVGLAQGNEQASPQPQRKVTLKEAYEKHVLKCNERISTNPEDRDAYFQRSYNLIRLGEYEKAILDLDRIIELHPKEKHAYSRRGDVLARSGRFTDAILDFDQALLLGKAEDEDNADYYYARGRAFSSLAEYEKALKDYSRALKRNPGHKKARKAHKKALGLTKTQILL